MRMFLLKDRDSTLDYVVSMMAYPLGNQVFQNGRSDAANEVIALINVVKRGELKAVQAFNHALAVLSKDGVKTSSELFQETMQACFVAMTSNLVDSAIINKISKIEAVAKFSGLTQEQAAQKIADDRKTKSEKAFADKVKNAGFIHESKIQTFNELESARIQELIKLLDDEREQAQAQAAIIINLRSELATQKITASNAVEQLNALIGRIQTRTLKEIRASIA